ncbi:unnamed protein product [Clonostachys rosea]|uniref:Major facilitator superfamily (MFS) profile domain-containing protein n=1 Tax=Bionectria ochroleuca TaxID=29856 RepID=A0ABY6UW73_BIOOC|nr:unnamed protein product [Clonostachys rosea]
MSETDFATAISILFVSYIPMQFPSNILVSRIPRPGLYICLMAIIWGAVSACTASVRTKEQLYAVRVVLGIAEAAYFPGALYFLSAWYKKDELAKRIGGVFMFQALGQALGGFIAAACLTLEGKHGIVGWRWLFIVEGVVTVGLGLMFALVMPEFPHNARLLTPDQRDLAVWRLENERGSTEVHEESSAWDGFKAAVSDKKLWLIVWCGGMGQAMGSVFNFFPSIIASLGYPKYESLLLTVPPYIVAMIGYYICSFLSDRYNKIYLIIIINLMASAPVYILGMNAPNTGSRYFAMCLMPVVSAQFHLSCLHKISAPHASLLFLLFMVPLLTTQLAVAPQVMLYKTNGLHMARPATKRALGMALINGLGGISNVWTSYLWKGGPQYYIAFGTLLGCAMVFLGSITGYKFWVRHLNKKLAGTSGEQADVMRKHHVSQEQVDMGWRYEGY